MKQIEKPEPVLNRAGLFWLGIATCVWWAAQRFVFGPSDCILGVVLFGLLWRQGRLLDVAKHLPLAYPAFLALALHLATAGAIGLIAPWLAGTEGFMIGEYNAGPAVGSLILILAYFVFIKAQVEGRVKAIADLHAVDGSTDP